MNNRLNIMNKIYNKIVMSIVVIASLVLFSTSCTKDSANSEGEGCLLMKLSLLSSTSNTKATEEDYTKILENSTLKIYKASGELIRRYEPATEVESNIYLISGDYKVVITAGFDTPATFNKEERKFFGEQDFTIEAKKTTDVTVKCRMVNTVVAVNFDETIASTFDLGAKTYISLSNTFSKNDAESNSVPTLLFTESGIGYFSMPDESSNLSWGFYAESSNPEIGAISKEGVIELPQSATKYTLNFKYSKTPDGFLDLTVKIDDSAIEYDDIMSFTPQPTVTGTDFDASTLINYINQELVYDVKGLKEIKKIEITGTDAVSGNSFSIIPFNEKAIVDGTAVSGVTASVIEGKHLNLTFSNQLFKNFNSGGQQIVTVYATDVEGSRGVATLHFNVSGVQSINNTNYWSNTGTINAYVTDENATNVTISYRKIGTSAWVDLPAVKGNDNNYSANVEANWVEGSNAKGLTTYTLASGITANSSFETKITINGDEYSPLTLNTDGGQTILNANMEDSGLSCWGNSNKTSTGWGSGNNSMAANLCKQGTRAGMGGSYCAYLAGSDVTLVDLAAGNLFLGQFNKGSFDGTVSFGQSFNWESRPTSFKLKYSASLGKVNANYHNGPLSSGSTDISRIFFAIVDWSGRHGVTSGTGSPSGVWNPAEVSSTDEGEIIGYAFYDITASTSEEMQTLELPIYYYNKTAKPSKDITIVISCATSAYGDYMNGSTDSKLWVDDFEFGY